MTFHVLIKRLEDALAEEYGWAATPVSRSRLNSVVESKAQRLQIAAEEYCQIAATSQSEMLALVEEAAASETYFFREPQQFELLRRVIVPGMLANRSGGDKLRVWSAACSTGEEAYSLAIVLDALCASPGRGKLEIFATDVRNRALLVASEARYKVGTLKQLSNEEREMYFTSSNADTFTVTPSIRRLVAFRRVNLLDQMFWKRMSGRYDLIVCTNLLTHLHGAAVRQMVSRLVKSLRQGGYLMVAPTENSYVENANLRPCKDAPTFFCRAA